MISTEPSRTKAGRWFWRHLPYRYTCAVADGLVAEMFSHPPPPGARYYHEIICDGIRRSSLDPLYWLAVWYGRRAARRNRLRNAK